MEKRICCHVPLQSLGALMYFIPLTFDSEEGTAGALSGSSTLFPAG